MEDIKEIISNLEHYTQMQGRDLFNTSIINHLTDFQKYLELSLLNKEEIDIYKSSTGTSSDIRFSITPNCRESIPSYNVRRKGYVKVSDIIDFAMKEAEKSIESARLIQLMLYKCFQGNCTDEDLKRLPLIDEPVKSVTNEMHFHAGTQNTIYTTPNNRRNERRKR